MDQAVRTAAEARAHQLVAGLRSQGVVGVAATFVDNSGIARVKTVPLDRLPQLAAWGVGTSTSFDRFRFDDWVVGPPDGSAAVGDLRIIPDLDRLVVLAAQPGWAWAPADRWEQSGEPHVQDSRLLLRRTVEQLAGNGITVRAAFEIEWVVSAGPGDDFVAGVRGPGYGMTRLIGQSAYARDLLAALAEQGVAVEQFHPEYADGQLELTVAPEDPIGAADTSVLVRQTIRAVGAAHGLRTSFSPKVDVAGVGNGGHVHLSPWRDGRNLMAGGTGRHGLTPDGEAFAAGLLAHLPGLLAVGAPSAASYLRLVPSHWAGAFAVWGLENREAAVRLVTGSSGSADWAANVEVKSFDLLANPYLLMAGLLAAGADGLSTARSLPEPVLVDPAVLEAGILTERGIVRLPTTLAEATEAFRADDVLTAAYGGELSESIVELRRSEIDLFADAPAETISAALRWTH